MLRVFLLAAMVAVAAGGAIEGTPSNFDETIINSGKNSIVKFLAPW